MGAFPIQQTSHSIRRRAWPARLGAVILPLWVATISFSQVVVRDKADPHPEDKSTVWFPYLFKTETFDLSAGLASIVSGRWQEQMTVYATAFYTKNESSRIWLGAYDYRIPGTRRFFLSPELHYTDYTNLRAYINGNPEFPNQRSGSNDSDPANFATGVAHDTSVQLQFRYVLPIGEGEKEVVNRYLTDRGFVEKSSQKEYQWNPFKSGRSYLFFEPFYRDQEAKLDTGDRGIRTNGIRIEFRHDNTDFTLNPSVGSKQIVAVERDFGKFGSQDQWTWWEFDYSKYISLGASGLARQQVLAFNAWISDSPTWKTEYLEDGTVNNYNRPPYFTGSTLGGPNRLRAYPDNRFNGPSAAFYGLEYRVIPHWNPFASLSFAGIPAIDWWQCVVFAEAGRVAESFDLEELHRDMRFDAGFGFRVYSQGIIGRIDFASANEGWAIQAMIGHPF